jgi:spore coat polysaccharide biosynthesis predicted glycosyltransferase SpsG
LSFYLQATKLKNAGTRIFTVGVTDAVDNNLLQSVATQPSYNFFVAEFNQLMNQIDAIINSVSNLLYNTHK